MFSINVLPSMSIKKLLFLIIALVILFFLFKITKKFKYEPLGKAKYSHTNDNWRELPTPKITFRPFLNPSNKRIYRFPQIRWLSHNQS